MKTLLPLLAIVLLGAGCTNVYVQNPPVADPPPTVTDPYEGWKDMQAGGVVSYKIPPNCQGDPGAGSTYIICPTAAEPEPLPELVIASDGISVLVHRYEDLESEIWDEVIASMRVITPLNRAIKIEIDE